MIADQTIALDGPLTSLDYPVHLWRIRFRDAQKIQDVDLPYQPDGVAGIDDLQPVQKPLACGGAFRYIKTVNLNVRPVYRWLEGRVRAHVLLCVLAYYLEWHMRQRLAPMLFDDTDKEDAEALRRSVVAQAQRSKAGVRKETTGRTPSRARARINHSSSMRT